MPLISKMISRRRRGADEDSYSSGTSEFVDSFISNHVWENSDIAESDVDDQEFEDIFKLMNG